jgi:hypothetical protein
MKLIEQFVKKLFDDIAPSKEVWTQLFGAVWLGSKRFHNGLPANYWRPQRNVIRCTSQRVTKSFIRLEDLTEFFDRRPDTGIGMIAASEYAERMPDRLVIGIHGNSQNEVVVHNQSLPKQSYLDDSYCSGFIHDPLLVLRGITSTVVLPKNFHRKQVY